MNRLARVIALALAGLIAGCGGDDDQTTTPGSGTLVTYARTGGVASTPVDLTIEADGSATVVAGVDPARVSFDIDADELDRLRSELVAADFGSFEPSDAPTGCADCYEYEVTYEGTTISYDESEEVSDSISTAVAHLSEIAEAHYPAEADQPPIVN